jgi:hypothetical protein
MRPILWRSATAKWSLAAAGAGEPLYAAFGFQVVERYDVALANGLSLPVVRMAKALAPR